MNVTRSIIIDAPLATVWHKAAHEFEHISEWASLVSASSVADGAPPTDKADMAGRVCTTPFGQSYEMFTSYDESRHTFTYEGIVEKTPPGMKGGSNTWTVEAVSDTQARLTMSADMELNLFPGLLMQIPMRLQMPRLLDMNLEEIKHWIETGQPHPRKVKAMNKARLASA